jgi:hypothetical protein
MTTLTQASHEWATRPADERFTTLADLHAHTSGIRTISRESSHIALEDLRVVTSESDGHTSPRLIGKAGIPAAFTHHSFGQLCRVVGAPAAYMRTLPAQLVKTNLSYALAMGEHTLLSELGEDGKTAKLLFAQNGDYKLRALTGNGYARIWNADISSRLLRLVEERPEWQPAPAAYDGSRGLYAGDTNMFAFLVDSDRRIFETDSHGGLGRGFFVSNSEVGDASFRLTTFLYNYICGNHMVWGAKGVRELRIPHIGTANTRAFRELTIELKAYSESSGTEDELKIVAARRYQIAATKDAVLDAVFGLRVPNLSKGLIEDSYDKAELHEGWYGSPRTAWGLASGLTEIARDLPQADERVLVERAAGRVLQMAF